MPDARAILPPPTTATPHCNGFLSLGGLVGGDAVVTAQGAFFVDVSTGCCLAVVGVVSLPPVVASVGAFVVVWPSPGIKIRVLGALFFRLRGPRNLSLLHRLGAIKQVFSFLVRKNHSKFTGHVVWRRVHPCDVTRKS